MKLPTVNHRHLFFRCFSFLFFFEGGVLVFVCLFVCLFCLLVVFDGAGWIERSQFPQFEVDDDNDDDDDDNQDTCRTPKNSTFLCGGGEGEREREKEERVRNE